MLSFEQCKKVLNSNKENRKYNDEEVRLISEFLHNWARLNAELIIEEENINFEHETNSDEESSHYDESK